MGRVLFLKNFAVPDIAKPSKRRHLGNKTLRCRLFVYGNNATPTLESPTAPMTAQNSAAQNSTHQRLEDSPQIPWAKNAAVDSAQAGGIRFENITKSYPSRTGEPTTVLQNLNLHIPAGQITVFVGPSGCGKTTSLRMINRMVEPNSGTITIDGVNVHEKNPYELRRGIGYVMQQGGLMPHRTVAQNIATVPRLLGASRKEAQARARLVKD